MSYGLSTVPGILRPPWLTAQSPPYKTSRPHAPRDLTPQPYLLGNLLPLQLQHLLLLVGVIHDVPAPNKQLALHGLGTQRSLETGFAKSHRIPKLRGFASLVSMVLPRWILMALNKNEVFSSSLLGPSTRLPLSARPLGEKERAYPGGI